MSAFPASSLRLLPDGDTRAGAEAAGFRLGARGTHTSRTIMLAELEAVLAAAGADAARVDYAAAIVEGNCLSKPTAATRRLSCQRLRELHGLDPALPLFRVLRRLWAFDPASRPLARRCRGRARASRGRGRSWRRPAPAARRAAVPFSTGPTTPTEAVNPSGT